MVMATEKREQVDNTHEDPAKREKSQENDASPRQQIRRRYAFQLRFRGKRLSPPTPYVDQFNNTVKVYRSYKAEYLDRVRYAPKIDAKEGGGAPAICFSSIGTGRALKLRPLGRLPPHIIEALNDQYMQLSHGMMDPEADLYNNDDQPVEHLFPSIIDKHEYRRLISEVSSQK